MGKPVICWRGGLGLYTHREGWGGGVAGCKHRERWRGGGQLFLLHVCIYVRSWLTEGTADDSTVTILGSLMRFNTETACGLMGQHVGWVWSVWLFSLLINAPTIFFSKLADHFIYKMPKDNLKVMSLVCLFSLSNLSTSCYSTSIDRKQREAAVHQCWTRLNHLLVVTVRDKWLSVSFIVLFITCLKIPENVSCHFFLGSNCSIIDR